MLSYCVRWVLWLLIGPPHEDRLPRIRAALVSSLRLTIFAEPTMATKEDDAAPAFRFKRRKTTHVRKIQLSSNNVPAQSLNTPVAVDSQTSALTPTIHTYPDDLQTYVEGDDDATPNLKEILRQRKRPQDRTREVARKAAERKIAVTSIQQYDEPAPGDKYSGRFVAQTGQVVDKDDEQM